MSDASEIVGRFASIMKVQQVVSDSPEGRDYASSRTQELLDELPALAREARYLALLRLTGGLHAFRGDAFSFGIFGFDEPGYGITSLDEGERLDGSFFRFGDLMLSTYVDNLVFAFDLAGEDRRVFVTPGSASTYEPYATDFDALVDRVLALAR